jgi:CRP/FNR family transcriptional regulator
MADYARTRQKQHDSPRLQAVPFLPAAGAPLVELLSDAHRRQLTRLATVRIVPARTVIYRADCPAVSVFIIGEGTVKSIRDLPSGRRRIVAFLFAHDLFGLAKAGRYVNTVQTITAARIYALDLHMLTKLFKRDGELQFQFLCKAVHALREAQHHNIIVGRRDAIGRVAMLLHLLLKQDGATGRGYTELQIPMTRSDIANYLGLSLEAVVRACRRLELQGIVAFPDRHRATIIDRRRFEALASNV